MIFGLVLGQLAILKRTLEADYEQLLRVAFSCFHGQKNNFKFLKNDCRVRYEGEKTKKNL